MRPSNFVQTYLQKTRNTNNRTQMNFSGDARYNNFTGAAAGSRYFNATGATVAAAPAAAPAPMATPSHPYVITISNGSASNVANFVLFNGNTSIYSTNFSNGNYVLSSVTVSSGLGNVTYQNLVSQSLTQPFTIGSTVVIASAVSAQIQQPINVTTTDASGLTQGVPIIFIKDPYQNQTDMLVNNTPYRIDGTTSMTIANVLPNAIFTLYLYPANNVNPASQLMGQDTTRAYANPGLIRVLPTATGAM